MKEGYEVEGGSFLDLTEDEQNGCAQDRLSTNADSSR